jgi:DNA-3-methyladenine glycosylase
VYLVYGMHDCLNVITEPPGHPAALLVRAVEPSVGADAMRTSAERRSAARRRAPAATNAPAARRRTPDARLAAGPGLVCAAFDVDRSLTGRDLFDPTAAIRIEPPAADEAPPAIVTGPRVGIGYAAAPWIDRPWRFAVAGSPSVSRPSLPGVPAGR